MTGERDLVLQDLFAQADLSLEGETFTAEVVAKTQRRHTRIFMALGGLALVMIGVIWVFSAPLLGFAQLGATVLTGSIFELGTGWLSWALSPVNNYGSGAIIAVKAFLMLRKKFRVASYIS